MTRFCVGFALWIWILASFCIGCATPRVTNAPKFDRTEEAAALVWKFYGAPGPVPRVVWVPRGACKQRNGDGGFLSMGRCVGGVTVSDGVVYSVTPDESFEFSALAHELRHAALMRWRSPMPHHIEVLTPDAIKALCDAKVIAPATQAMCERHYFFLTVVEQANAALRAAGM